MGPARTELSRGLQRLPRAPREALGNGGGAAQNGGLARRGADGDVDDCGPPRRGVPRVEHAGRRPRARPARPAGQLRARRRADPLRGGRSGVTRRLRQRGQPSPHPRDLPPGRDGHSRFARRDARDARRAAAHRDRRRLRRVGRGRAPPLSLVDRVATDAPLARTVAREPWRADGTSRSSGRVCS